VSATVDVRGLVKVFNGKVRAVDGVSFIVNDGEVFGLLGPNGAGKTTIIKVLTTQIKATAGEAFIGGLDVNKHANRVRSIIGYVPQDVSVQGDLTGYENLLMYAKLYSVPRKEREKRITEALNFMDLLSRADDLVKTYSGGMMRRIEAAEALVNRPQVLFLDEPTIGLDPSGRRTLWERLLKLKEEIGTTILMTTHYMDEADEFCDRVAIINMGKIEAIGSPRELKETVGGEIVSINAKGEAIPILLKETGFEKILDQDVEKGHVSVVVNQAEKAVPVLVETLWENGVNVDSISIKKPTLDDVFLKYAGARIDEADRASWREARRFRRTVRRIGR